MKPPSPDELARVRARAVARFRRMLADLFPTEDVLSRRRESEGADVEEAA
jgi:hypothetical protein